MHLFVIPKWKQAIHSDQSCNMFASCLVFPYFRFPEKHKLLQVFACHQNMQAIIFYYSLELFFSR